MIPDYIFKRINAEIIKDLRTIFYSAFKKKIKYKNLINKFNTNYCKISYIGFITYSSKKIPCSYYGVYPALAKINGNEYLICQSGDTMTHIDHVGKGLFYESAELTYDLCKKNNIIGVFGFPSKTSYPGFKKKLNWTFKDNIHKYSFKVPILPLAFLRTRNVFFNFIYTIWLRFILLFYNKGIYFNSSIENFGQDGILRSDQFWKYKMNSNFNLLLNISNTNVVLKLNGKLGIGDIDINKQDDILPILRSLKIFAFLTFNSEVNFFVSPDTIIDLKLSKLKNHKNALPIGYRDFSNIVSLKNLKFTYFDFDTF